MRLNVLFLSLWGTVICIENYRYTKSGDDIEMVSECTSVKTKRTEKGIQVTKSCDSHPKCNGVAGCHNATYELFEILGIDKARISSASVHSSNQWEQFKNGE